MTFREQVQRDAAIPHTAFEFGTLPEAMESASAIVFIYARWSGTATHAWQTLTGVLAGLDQLPAILVIDADGFTPAAAVELLGELPQGKGETIWIKEGRILARLSNYGIEEASTLMKYTERLLN